MNYTPGPWKVSKSSSDVTAIYHKGATSPIAVLGDFQ